jgi:hypothetical protein
MCGACGSPPGRHWSTPFLATVPARASAACAVTAIAGRVGCRVTVAASAAGYSVTTATGQSSVAADLGEVWARLRRLRGFEGIPPVPPPRLPSAGPATVPALHAADGQGTRGALHRLPVVLAWLAGVDGRGPRRLRLRLGLTAEIDVAIDVRDGTVVRCGAVPAAPGDGPVEQLDDPGGAFGACLETVLRDCARPDEARLSTTAAARAPSSRRTP